VRKRIGHGWPVARPHHAGNEKLRKDDGLRYFQARPHDATPEDSRTLFGCVRGCLVSRD
jgi:hypothetical protein